MTWTSETPSHTLMSGPVGNFKNRGAVGAAVLEGLERDDSH